jgi:small GTP-binding protein
MIVSVMDSPEQPILGFKILCLGSTRAGKTLLIRQFSETNGSLPESSPEVSNGSGRRQYSVDNLVFSVQFWELSGGGGYLNELRDAFYSHTDGLLFVFDLSSRESFFQCSAWVDEAKKQGLDLSAAVICGNKIDLQRAIRRDEADAFAKQLSIPYFETDAINGRNVTDPFIELIRMVIAKRRYCWPDMD